MTIRSYSDIYELGHQALTAGLFAGPVVVQEKVDGSQFSFGLVNEGTEAEPTWVLQCRSKGKQQEVGQPDSMFEEACATVRALEPTLVPGWTYRGEYLQKPKHNSLTYSRVPARHIILFDIDAGYQDYLSPTEVRHHAAHLGMESVPTLFEGALESAAQVKSFLAAESCLGGCPPEGVVIKAYGRYGADKKTLMGKYVTEQFKETHKEEWRTNNPTKMDVVDALVAELCTEARWAKAVQHLRENGQLTGSPKDIGPLIREVVADVKKEEADYIKQRLYDWGWSHIGRRLTGGLPQWYKDRLLNEAFATSPATITEAA
jgi:hypothetical protein